MSSYKENDLRNIDDALYLISRYFMFVSSMSTRNEIFEQLRLLIRRCRLSNSKSFKKKIYFDQTFKKTKKNCCVCIYVIGKYNHSEKMLECLKSGKTLNSGCAYFSRNGKIYTCTVIL